MDAVDLVRLYLENEVQRRLDADRLERMANRLCEAHLVNRGERSPDGLVHFDGPTQMFLLERNRRIADLVAHEQGRR